MHVLLTLSREQTIVAVARAMKGASWHDLAKAWPELGFHWQHGYGVFSVSERTPDAAIEYVGNQRDRHATGRLEACWEPGGFQIDDNE